MQRVLTFAEFNRLFNANEDIYNALLKYEYVFANQQNEYLGSFNSLSDLLSHRPDYEKLVIYKQDMLLVNFQPEKWISLKTFKEQFSHYQFPVQTVENIYDWLKNGWFVIIDENEQLYYKTAEQCLNYISDNETFDVWTPLHIKCNAIKVDDDVYLNSDLEVSEFNKFKNSITENILFSNKLTDSSKLNVLRAFNLF